MFIEFLRWVLVAVTREEQNTNIFIFLFKIFFFNFRAADWKLDAPDWTGRMRLISRGKDLELKLEDKTSGKHNKLKNVKKILVSV